MRTLFERQLEKATDATGKVDLALLGRLVTAAYDEAELDRRRTDRSIELMVGELTALQAGLEADIRGQTAQLRQSKEKLATQNTRFQTAIENMSQGLAMFDARQRLVICNRQYLEMYSLPRRYGRVGTTLLAILKARIAAGSAGDGDPADYIEARIRTAVTGVSSTVTQHLEDGRVISITHRAMSGGGWVTVHEDISGIHAMQAELARQAYHDTLTELPNRNMLYQSLGNAFETRREGESLAVLCLDLDGFKAVNDTMGHLSGDELLRQVAARLRDCVGTAGIVGRMGGDEFAVIHPRATDQSTLALARALVDTVRKPFQIDDHEAPVGISIGVAMAPEDGTTTDRLLKNADLALYTIKRARQGGFRFFEPGMDEEFSERSRLERDLRRALARGEFVLHYQPVFDLREQRICGFEALLRWQHPTEGVIPPEVFVPVAEELGLIVPIGEWVIREAFAEAASWPAAMRIAVNVSSGQFSRGNLLGVVMNALATSGLAHERVEIEITETVFLEDSQSNLEALERLHQLGLKVVLDDFGTGYSTLSYLLAFPFDKIKIDSLFVQAGDARAQEVLRSVADMGHRLGMTTTAEGIETPEQLTNIRALGYHEAQGFLISRPLTREAVHQLLSSARRGTPAVAESRKRPLRTAS